jgi:hypothetical protein
MWTARIVIKVPELAWIAPWLPWVAQGAMAFIGFFGILFVFGKPR